MAKHKRTYERPRITAKGPIGDWSAEQLRTTQARKKRAMLAFFKLYERYNTLHSANCRTPVAYRKTLIRRLGVVLPLTGSGFRIVDGYLT